MLLIGKKVTYVPHPGCMPSDYRNGIVKSHPEHTTDSVFVVFNCAGDWKNYQDYTAQLTPVDRLVPGWLQEEAEQNSPSDVE